MKYTIAFISIFAIICIIGGYAWAKIKNKENDANVFINKFSSILFYGAIFSVLCITIYYQFG